MEVMQGDNSQWLKLRYVTALTFFEGLNCPGAHAFPPLPARTATCCLTAQS